MDARTEWEKIVELCKKAGLETLGEKAKKSSANDPEIGKLQKESQMLRNKIESNTNENTKKEMKKRRREIKKEITQIIKKHEEKILDDKLKYLESVKNDSNKYHAAMRELRSQRKPKPTIVKDKNGKIAGTAKKKIELITTYFKSVLSPENMKEEIKSYPPAKMKHLFDGEEVEKTLKSLKNGKSTGIDKCNAEYIKYAPRSIHNRIAGIYNKEEETGEKLDHLVVGLLTPLPKPGKPKGPPANFRPIILLSILCKILTI